MSITIGIQVKIPFAKLADVHPRHVLVCDDRFDCVSPFTMLRIKEDENGLYFKCTEGKHYLDGQADDDGVLEGLAFRSGHPVQQPVLSTQPESNK